MKHTYLNCLAQLGIGAAHPGGIQLTKKILSREKIEKTASLLDAGCGTGQTSAYISDLYGCKVTSLDSNKTMVDKAKQRFQSQKLPIEVKLGSTENQPFDDASFDIVLSESVIVFTNIFLTILEFKRILKPNGLLLAIEMVLEKPISKKEQEEITHFYQVSHILTEHEWESIFQNAGFKSICIETITHHFDKNDVDNASNFFLSENIDDVLFELLAQHVNLTEKYQGKLGFRVFRCKNSDR